MTLEAHTPSALLTDLYEVTMAHAEYHLGTADRASTFSLFVRNMPTGRGFLIAAGLHDCLSWLENLQFDTEDLDALAGLGRFDDDFLDWLGDLRFEGDVRALPEGTPVLAGEPILEIDAPFAHAQLAETYLLNQVTLQTVLATKAARCVHAADGRPIVDFALRRTPGIDAGMKLVRIAALVGLAGTSNVAGSMRYPVSASGTMAHSFVQAYTDETQAFRDFASVYGDDTVLLVDTYDTRTGVSRAIEVALERRRVGETIRGIRLDSGDLATLARDARQALDDSGLTDVSIMASGGLDEYEIDRLVREEGAPIDGFGVGTALGTSSDAPSIDSVYKLVELDERPVRKTSTKKATWPGRKQLWRQPDWRGCLAAHTEGGASRGGDVLALASEPAPSEAHEPLLEVVMRKGERTAAGQRPLSEAHRHFSEAFGRLPAEMLALRDPVVLEPEPSAELHRLTSELDGRNTPA